MSHSTIHPNAFGGRARGILLNNTLSRLRRLRFILVLIACSVVAVLACSPDATSPTPVKPPQDELWRINTAMDSLRVALRDYYVTGGRVRQAWLMTVDTAQPPILILSYR